MAMAHIAVLSGPTATIANKPDPARACPPCASPGRPCASRRCRSRRVAARAVILRRPQRVSGGGPPVALPVRSDRSLSMIAASCTARVDGRFVRQDR
jgi:hypothetical protein